MTAKPKPNGVTAGRDLANSLSILAINGADAETLTRAVTATINAIPTGARTVALTSSTLQLVHLLDSLLTTIDAHAPGFREAFAQGHNDELARRIVGGTRPW